MVSFGYFGYTCWGAITLSKGTIAEGYYYSYNI